MTTFSPREIVSELDRFIIGQNDAKRAVAIALAQPLAPPAARGPDARRGHAQEHPDDRADGRRQDRNFEAAGQAGRRALHQGRGHQVHRGGLCRPRRRADRSRSGRGGDRAGAGEDARGRQGARPSQRRGARAGGAGRQDGEPGDAGHLPPEAAGRRARRQGNRDRGRRYRHRRHAWLRHSGHARRQYRRPQHQRHAAEGDGRQAHQDCARRRSRIPISISSPTNSTSCSTRTR